MPFLVALLPYDNATKNSKYFWRASLKLLNCDRISVFYIGVIFATIMATNETLPAIASTMKKQLFR